LKKDIAKKWVKALRSGKYGQTTDELQDDGGFCCLGVLCEIAPKKLRALSKEFNYKYLEGEDLDCQPAIKEWAGINSGAGVFENGENLVDYNDSATKDFDEIADIIEERWEEL